MAILLAPTNCMAVLLIEEIKGSQQEYN